MTRHAEITERFGDGPHIFRLDLGGWRELQQKTKVGPPALYRRIATGNWMADDGREVIRIALIGGGMAPLEALALVERYVDERPMFEWIPLALKIIEASLIMPEEEPAKKNESEAAGNGRAAFSPSEPSMPTVQ